MFLSTPSSFTPAWNPISNFFSFWVQSLFLWPPCLSCLGSSTVNVLLSCVNAALCAFYVCICMDIFVVSCVCMEMVVRQPRRKGRHRGENRTVCATSHSLLLSFHYRYVWLWHLSFCLPRNHITRAWISQEKEKILEKKYLLQYGFYLPFDDIHIFFIQRKHFNHNTVEITVKSFF